MGSQLAKELLLGGCHVVGVDDLSGGYLDNVPKGVEFYEADICDFTNNLKVLKGVDVVFHMAAHAYDGLSVFSPSAITKNVYSGTMALCSASVENEVRRFVFCSSMARYGSIEGPFSEDQAPKPVTPYGVAKYAAELSLSSLSAAHGMEYSICVPHNIYGPQQKYDDPYRNVVAIMINRMLQGEQPVLYGGGRQKRCFSFVKDCLQVLPQLGFDRRAKGEIYNIGPDEEEVTLLQLAQEIANIIDFSLDPILLPERPQDVMHANCSSQKIRNTFGYQTTFNLREGLIEMIEWVQRRGPKPFVYEREIEIKNHQLPKTWREQIF